MIDTTWFDHAFVFLFLNISTCLQYVYIPSEELVYVPVYVLFLISFPSPHPLAHIFVYKILCMVVRVQWLKLEGVNFMKMKRCTTLQNG